MSDIGLRGSVLRRTMAALVAGTCLGSVAAQAQDATWAGPGGAWSTSTNWSPQTVPTGTATFAGASPTFIHVNGNPMVGTLQFNAGAPRYILAMSSLDVLLLTGLGIINNSANVPILDNSGELNFANSSSAGNATIVTNFGGSTDFSDTSSGGVARFITNAGGAVFISALSSAGTTAGSIEGAGSYYLGSRTLTVGGNDLSTVVDGLISGTGGSLIKVGSGTLTLAGANSYTGPTAVNGGALIVNGSIVSATSVNSGGMLAGTGTVGSVTVNSGGTFAPGPLGTPGSMTIAGNLAFQSGALYLAQVSPATASLANVSGAATLAGTVQAMFAPGSYVARSYTILSAAGGLGGTTFDGVTGVYPNFGASLSYTPTDVILNLSAALGIGTGLNQNQQNVAGAINSVFNNGGALPPNFQNLFSLTGGKLATALSQASGEVATGAQQGAFQLTNQFLGVMLDPFVDGRGGIAGINGPALGYAPEPSTRMSNLPREVTQAYGADLGGTVRAPVFEQRWGAWGAAYGGSNRTNGDAAVVGSHDLTARAAGMAAGLDYRVAPGTAVGFALAGGGTDWKLADGLGGGRSDALQAGFYAATRSGPVYLATALGYTAHWMSTDRTAPFGDHLTAKFNAQSFGARLEGGYRYDTPLGALMPYLAAQGQAFRTPNYSETGGAFALAYDARNATAFRGEFGTRFDQLVALDAGVSLALRGRLAWAHDWVSDPTLNPVFQTLPGASFVVNGATPAQDSALVTAGAELKLANGFSLLGKFEGEFAARSSTYGGSGTVRVVW